MTPATAHCSSPPPLATPGAILSYDVRQGTDTGLRPLMLIGSPMGAGGFVTLASHFPERTIITYDPRGVERSTKDDPTSQSPPRSTPRTSIGSSRRWGRDPWTCSRAAVVPSTHSRCRRVPEDVVTLVAHEPPLAALVADREAALATCRAVARTNRSAASARDGPLPRGRLARRPFTDELAAQPGPDPAMFGMPSEDDGTRTDPLLSQNISPAPTTSRTSTRSGRRRRPSSSRWERGAAPRSHVARPRRSRSDWGIAPVIFPGDHSGFLGGSTVRPEIPTPSRRSSMRCSTRPEACASVGADGRAG